MENTKPGDAKKDLYWVILFLFILAIVWLKTGGSSRPSATSGPFLNQPRQQHTEELKQGTEKIMSGKAATPTAVSSDEEAAEKPVEPTVESAYKYKATLNVGYGARQTDSQKEYLTIKASSQNTAPLLITGWSLLGKKGLDIKIGQGAYLPYSAQVNPQQDIYLKPGEKAIVVTGESPVGTSFRLNKCIGYFEQFQDFYPNLTRNCPRPADEDLPLNLNDACLDYLERLPRCEMLISVPWYLSANCQSYINEKVNYKTCVDLHKNDPDFYGNEWRIYLGRTEELWKEKRETIILRDGNNNTIDWKSY